MSGAVAKQEFCQEANQKYGQKNSATIYEIENLRGKNCSTQACWI